RAARGHDAEVRADAREPSTSIARWAHARRGFAGRTAAAGAALGDLPRVARRARAHCEGEADARVRRARAGSRRQRRESARGEQARGWTLDAMGAAKRARKLGELRRAAAEARGGRLRELKSI